MLPARKTKVLFVGAFKPAINGTQGGQLVACTSLLNSVAASKVNWVLLDTTATTNQHRSFFSRLLKALKRLVVFYYHLCFSRVDTVLLFCSSGFSFREKGVMAIWAKRFGKRVVLAPRSGLIKNDIAKSKAFRQQLIKVFKHLDVLLCQGPAWQTYYREISGNENLNYQVVHNWIDLDKYPLVERSFKEKDNTKVLFLGWITANKGVFDILSAAEVLADENITFMLGGDGDAYAALAEEIAKRKLQQQIRLLGWIRGNDKNRQLEDADIFILPSYREGYPNALIEAMACSLPVVASRVGSIPDLVTDGQNGFLIEAGEPAALAKHLKNLHHNNDLRKKLGTAARKTVEAKNDLVKATQQIIDLL